MHGPIPIRIVADFQIVRLTDAFTTVPHGEHLAATVTRARCHKQTGGEGVRGGSAVGQSTSLIFTSYRWSFDVYSRRVCTAKDSYIIGAII